MSLLDIVEEKYGTPVRGSKGSKSTESPLPDLKDLKEPRPKRSELREVAGEDWAEISTDPAKLKAFAELVMITDMRHRGIVPDHYTATINCKHCGPVPIFEGCWPESDGCPWCFNRLRGLPMPDKHDTTRSMK